MAVGHARSHAPAPYSRPARQVTDRTAVEPISTINFARRRDVPAVRCAAAPRTRLARLAAHTFFAVEIDLAVDTLQRCQRLIGRAFEFQALARSLGNSDISVSN